MKNAFLEGFGNGGSVDVVTSKYKTPPKHKTPLGRVVRPSKYKTRCLIFGGGVTDASAYLLIAPPVTLPGGTNFQQTMNHRRQCRSSIKILAKHVMQIFPPCASETHLSLAVAKVRLSRNDLEWTTHLSFASAAHCSSGVEKWPKTRKGFPAY